MRLDQAFQNAGNIVEAAVMFESRGRLGTAIRMPVFAPTANRQAHTHRLARRRPMDRTDLRKTDTRAESLTAQPVEFLVGQVLDVPLHICNAGTKSYRDAITYGGPVLDVYGKSARGAIRAQMVNKR